MIKHFQSLQCLYSISKKKLWMEFIMKFIKIKTSKSWFINFWWKPDMSKVSKNGGLLSFCNILRKSIATVFVFVRQIHSDTLQGSSHVCCYLFLQTFQLSRFYQNSPGFWYALPLCQIESFCPSFCISYQKNVHIYIIFHQQCKTIHLWSIIFIVIHALNAIRP